MNYLGYLGISDLCLLSSASRITELGLSSRAPKASRHPGSSGVCSPGTQLFSSSVFLSSFYRSSANTFLALNYLWHGYWINKTFSRAWDLWVEIFKNNLWEMKQNKASHLKHMISILLPWNTSLSSFCNFLFSSTFHLFLNELVPYRSKPLSQTA